jgi:TetR/AcrR family transcriptional regulator, transcriptional repressor for nem operon
MRVSREEAARNREKVVQTASRKFRDHGYDGIGVAGLMEAAGLTHGGFYKQFEDKEALIVEATAHALASNLEKWREVVANTNGDPCRALLEWYLQKGHLKYVADGCTYAALAAEVPRHGPELRRAFEHGLEEALSCLTAEMQDKNGSDDRTEAIRTLSQMVGTLILARAVNSRALRGDPRGRKIKLTATTCSAERAARVRPLRRASRRQARVACAHRGR